MATRRERVVLDLQDDFTPGMMKAAGATALLNRELGRLSGQEIAASRSSQMFVRDIERIGREAKGADSSINQLTGRLRVLGEVAAVLSPALAPLGGVAIAGVAGLANQMGAAAIAGGVLIGSLQGVGDALSAMNKAQLEPTDKNLAAAEKALKRLTPAAREFAEAAFDLKPALVAIRNMGQEALMPGLTESLDNLERLGPRVGGIFETVAGAMGDIAADSSASLASDRWADFFSFVEREVPDAITELATTVGSLTHGMVELWEAFTPLNDDFSSWLMGVAAGFDQWATGLSATEGFAEFVDYIQTTGPQLADTLGAVANAVVQIVQATAPLATPVLAGLEAAAKAIGAIADSDLGTPIMGGVAALALLNRSLAVTASLSKVSLQGGLFAGLGTAAVGAKKGAGSFKGLTADLSAMSKQYGNVSRAQSLMLAGMSQTTGAAQRTKESLGGVAKAGAGLAGLGILATGAADGLGLTNTASLALMGSLVPGGVIIGAAAGALLDIKAAGEGATFAIQGLDAAVQSGDMSVLKEQIAAAKAELADINDLDFGGDIFDRIGFQVADTFGGPSADDAKKKIDAARKALEALEEEQRQQEAASKRTAIAFLSQTGANVDLGRWSRRTAEQIKAQAAAIIEAQDAAKKTASSFVTLGNSLNDGKVSLGDWIKEMSDSADALINFTKNSRTAAKRGLNEGLIASLQDAGKEGALRMRQLANATDEEIARANAAWRKGKKAMQDYVDFKVPPKKPKVDVSQSLAEIERLEARLRAIKDESVNVVVRQIGATTLGPRNEAADGATVPKTGKPYADRHLYLLADGEEVISNRYGQADRHRSLLKAINGGLADGGTAETKAQKKAREAREKAQRAAEERRQREEDRRQRRLDAQRTKDLLASDLRDEEEQARLELLDARRRLRSAKKAGRSPQEIREAQLAVKTERNDVIDIRTQKAQDARDAEEERTRREEEERAEHASQMFLAAIEGQERAAQGLIDAAQEQKRSAEEVRDGWAQAMERAGSAATAGFQSDLFGQQQRGLWSGGPGGGTGVSWLDALNGDIAGLQQRQGLISQLSAQGVTGSALEALLAQGNNAQVQDLIGSGRAGEFAAMFAQREALLGSTAQMAGRAAYGAQYDASAAAVAAVDARIQFLEAQLAAISGQRPINVYEAYSAEATAAEIARLQAIQGAA